MNVTLWIVASVLAAVFLLAGAMKIAQPKEKLAESGQAWAEDFPPVLIKFIGLAEVLGALGLVLPGAFDVATVLVPIAAVGIGVLMVGAAITHLRRNEPQMLVPNAVLFAAAAFVAWGRFGPHAF